jgi:hypothetical protein
VLIWVGLVQVGWVISGQVPRQMGYRSRHDRYWRTGNLPPRAEPRRWRTNL